MKKTIIFPHKPGNGGPGSFQKRFESELLKNNYNISYAENNPKEGLIFIVGGTGKIFWLLKMKFKGIPIVHRLDGINWIHRKKRGKRDWKSYLQSELNNLLIKLIHGYLADYIVYQSIFVNKWWNKKGWRKRRFFSVINNAVDLSFFKPNHDLQIKKPKIVCLEGNLDYSPYAIELINEINNIKFIDFEVYGSILSSSEQEKLSERVDYRGKVESLQLPAIFSGNIYLSLDINPACPNTVIEALACGAPVVAFDTGSLKELVHSEAGIIVPYGSDPWKLGYPDVNALIEAINTISKNYSFYSKNARILAEQKYSIDDLTENYLQIIEDTYKVI